MPADALDSPAPDASSLDPAATASSEPAATAHDQDEASPERLITLTDGVVAIALTLLILGIQVPSPDGLRNPDSMSELAGALVHTLDSWISYVVSFYVIAQFWLLHRQVFRGIRRHHDGLAALNFVFLFTITVMPFTSDLIGKYPENSLAVIIFSANLIVTNLATYRMLSFSRRRGLINPQGAAALDRHKSLQGIFSLFIYAVAIPVALINPVAAKLCWLGLALTPRLASLVAKRRGAAGKPVSPPA
ncbi:MAG TPA: TMEM175 family protein [Trebonia sp.]|jgi:uncharacterized membrane protein|nr:TMEM175 family protein [Trebonia sp.]